MPQKKWPYNMISQPKTIAIHQPYFLPYVGYFQLICYADTFVILDDVSYIKKGWINRNNILLNNQSFLISIPIEKASQNKLIIDTSFFIDDSFLRKNLSTIESTYKKAPNFKEAFDLYKEIIFYENKNVSFFIKNSLDKILNYLNLSADIKLSHQISHDKLSKNADKLISITHSLNGTHYINSIGGQRLYHRDSFSSQGLYLSFLAPHLQSYKQFSRPFVENLSILDVLMFNSPKDVKSMVLKNFSIV